MVDTVQRVRGILFGRWLMAWQVQDELCILYGQMVSESAATARIRDCRKPRHGGWTVQTRLTVTYDAGGKRHDKWEYRIPRNKKQHNEAI